MARVAVGDDRSHVVYIRRAFALLRAHLAPVVPVLAVVHLLRFE